MIRPVKVASEILPLNLIRLRTPSCNGVYADSWIRKIKDGYFVRLYTKLESSEQIEKAIQIGVKIAKI